MSRGGAVDLTPARPAPIHAVLRLDRERTHAPPNLKRITTVYQVPKY